MINKTTYLLTYLLFQQYWTISLQKDACLFHVIQRVFYVSDIQGSCISKIILNSTQLNFIVTYLQLNSWTAGLLNIAK